ncbi:MAG: UDP-N-acetylmuramate-L-alanine ligase [Parcubacteria group bacterium GW2011_GWA1_47_8]|nr:MAG: UDP-N-acetylmuramate-L-alanine ligase [Parcubacteria group bacterium GW2011_GWA1_47_8]
MNKIFLDRIHSIHFIGIGGIGVSAIARMMLLRDVRVSGSDKALSVVTDRLVSLGARIFVGHEVKNLPDDPDAVVYSPAVPTDNSELVVARERGIPIYSYPEILGEISRGMHTIAVAGTHGKTTTTAMLADVFIEAKKSPTVIVGSMLKKWGDNFVAGESNIFIVEACEYKRSFLHLSPEVLVITNIDNDHLDYYGTIEGVQKAFQELVEKVPATGVIVCDPNDPRVAPVLTKAVAHIVDYQLGGGASKLRLQVAGEHNIKNAKAALAVAHVFGIMDETSARALGGFQGTWRRMEFVGRMANGAQVYDDYAHHPTEVRATLQGIRAKHPDERIRVVFEPHLYSRVKFFQDDFARGFGDADEVIIAPIYAGREEVDPLVTKEILAEVIGRIHPHAHVEGDFVAIETYLRTTAQKDDIIVLMGAGDVYKLAPRLLEK